MSRAADDIDAIYMRIQEIRKERDHLLTQPYEREVYDVRFFYHITKTTAFLRFLTEKAYKVFYDPSTPRNEQPETYQLLCARVEIDIWASQNALKIEEVSDESQV